MDEVDPIARARRAARTAAVGALVASSYSWLLAREKTVAPEARRAMRQRHFRRFLRRCLEVFSVTVLQEGEATQSEQGRIVVSNHRSGLDIPLLGSRFAGVFLSRADLSQWPVVGACAKHLGTLFVDRSDTNSRAGAVKAMRKALKERETVLVFPEGTTYPGDDIRPFHPGAFVAGKDLPVLVQPVGVAYEPAAQYIEKSFGAHLSKVAALRSVRCAMVIGEARALGPSRDESERTRQEVIALVKRARALLDR